MFKYTLGTRIALLWFSTNSCQLSLQRDLQIPMQYTVQWHENKILTCDAHNLS